MKKLRRFSRKYKKIVIKRTKIHEQCKMIPYYVDSFSLFIWIFHCEAAWMRCLHEASRVIRGEKSNKKIWWIFHFLLLMETFVDKYFTNWCRFQRSKFPFINEIIRAKEMIFLCWKNQYWNLPLIAAASSLKHSMKIWMMLYCYEENSSLLFCFFTPIVLRAY